MNKLEMARNGYIPRPPHVCFDEEENGVSVREVRNNRVNMLGLSRIAAAIEGDDSPTAEQLEFSDKVKLAGPGEAVCRFYGIETGAAMDEYAAAGNVILEDAHSAVMGDLQKEVGATEFARLTGSQAFQQGLIMGVLGRNRG